MEELKTCKIKGDVDRADYNIKCAIYDLEYQIEKIDKRIRRIKSILPIKDKTTLFFKCKRAIERPVLRRFRKKHPNEVIQNDQT